MSSSPHSMAFTTTLAHDCVWKAIVPEKWLLVSIVRFNVANKLAAGAVASYWTKNLIKNLTHPCVAVQLVWRSGDGRHLHHVCQWDYREIPCMAWGWSEETNAEKCMKIHTHNYVAELWWMGDISASANLLNLQVANVRRVQYSDVAHL